MTEVGYIDMKLNITKEWRVKWLKKSEVKQIYYINKEIEMWRKELAQARSQSRVMGQQITDMPHASGISDKTADIAVQEVEYEQLIEELEYNAFIMKNKIMRYITSIDDSVVRQIIFHRYISLLPWKIVACEVGGDNTADSVRMIDKRYFEEGKSSSLCSVWM